MLLSTHRNTKSRTLRKGGEEYCGNIFCFTAFNLTELLSVSLQVVWTLIPPLLHSKSNSHSTRSHSDSIGSQPQEPIALFIVSCIKNLLASFPALQHPSFGCRGEGSGGLAMEMFSEVHRGRDQFQAKRTSLLIPCFETRSLCNFHFRTFGA